MTEREWLELYTEDPNAFRLEAAKVLREGPWRHAWENVEKHVFVDDLNASSTACGTRALHYRCRKCQQHVENTDYADLCVPDPIPLDWDYAMKAFQTITPPIRRITAASKMREAMVNYHPIGTSTSRACAFFAVAQPHHYIIAAITAKEGE